jgi:predicted MPP superfamily phosphohydrolase
MNRRSFLKRWLRLILVAGVVGYPLFIERYRFQINRYDIPVAGLPPVFEGFTIVQLTDLHYGPLMPLALVRHLIHQANALEKDIIVCTGDYVNEHDRAKQIDRVWPELIKLEAADGVYSVLGNHDHWADARKSIDWLRRSGQDVRHRAVAINRGAARIWIGGAGDFWEDEPGIDRAFRTVPPQEFKILLAHNPDTIDTVYTTRVDLVIAGHTHGGQVRVPFWGPPVLPVINKRYASGIIHARHTTLFISRGLGWAIVPVRLNCLPEIAVLRLKQASAAGVA